MTCTCYDAYAADKRELRRRKVALVAELWEFLRTCQDGDQWETIAHLLWQVKDLKI